MYWIYGLYALILSIHVLEVIFIRTHIAHHYLSFRIALAATVSLSCAIHAVLPIKFLYLRWKQVDPFISMNCYNYTEQFVVITIVWVALLIFTSLAIYAFPEEIVGRIIHVMWLILMASSILVETATECMVSIMHRPYLKDVSVVVIQHHDFLIWCDINSVRSIAFSATSVAILAINSSEFSLLSDIKYIYLTTLSVSLM
jgi:hypothetical protein